MSGFYVGIAACGCVRAAMVDDEQTTPKHIAEFARRQQKMKRSMAHADADPWKLNPDCDEHQHCPFARAEPSGDASPLSLAGGEGDVRRQYYYKKDGCKAIHHKDADCICWRDEGTGPITDGSARTWRERPLAARTPATPGAGEPAASQAVEVDDAMVNKACDAYLFACPDVINTRGMRAALEAAALATQPPSGGGK